MSSAIMLPRDDLNLCHDAIGDAWETLREARLFVTGGTGMIGKWLLETLVESNARRALGVEIVVLTRNAARFQHEMPHLACAGPIRLLEGDVRTFAAPDGDFDFVIHGATDVVASTAPQAIFDTCVEGTRRVLDVAARAGSCDMLLLSSGAVYGRQPTELSRVPETYCGGPDPMSAKSAYAEGKRAAEWLVAAEAEKGAIRGKAARIYALVGPYLPLDSHFAIGNFIRDALEDKPIVLTGDGTNIRSYLHLADVCIWLWTILLRGRSGTAYNVGSDEPIALADLARRVAALLAPGTAVEIRGKSNGASPERYVPETERARSEFGLTARVALDDAILRTAAWHQAGSIR